MNNWSHATIDKEILIEYLLIQYDATLVTFTATNQPRYIFI